MNILLVYSFFKGLSQISLLCFKLVVNITYHNMKIYFICSSYTINENYVRAFYITVWRQRHDNCTSPKAFTYQNSFDGVSSAIYGVFPSYNGCGYVVELNLDLDIAMTSVRQLEKDGWVDRFTRLVVLESMILNVNSRLFSRIRTYFEISTAGMVLSHGDLESTRLYPYVEIGDYVTLAAQMIFIIITMARLMILLYRLSKCRFTTAAILDISLQLIQLCLALSYIICYIWRIVATIDAIEDLMNNKGIHVQP